MLLDVREQWEFDYCHLDDSEHIPMHEIPTSIEDMDKNREIVVICHHGIRSRQVGYYLEQQGFANIINLDGGLEAWARSIDSSMKRY